MAFKKYLGQIVIEAKLYELVRGGGDGIADAVIMLDMKGAFFGLLFKSFVVVSSAARGVFDAVLHAVEVNHLMNESSDNVLDGSGESASTDIDFMAVSAVLVLPDFRASDMPVGSGSALDGEDYFWECIFKKALVTKIIDFVKISAYAVVFGHLFHDFLLHSIDFWIFV